MVLLEVLKANLNLVFCEISKSLLNTGAVLGGAQVLEGCPVTRILVDDGKVQLEEGA